MSEEPVTPEESDAEPETEATEGEPDRAAIPAQRDLKAHDAHSYAGVY